VAFLLRQYRLECSLLAPASAMKAAIPRSACRTLFLNAFREALALPGAVRGPVGVLPRLPSANERGLPLPTFFSPSVHARLR
jgi:hypothetical protein